MSNKLPNRVPCILEFRKSTMGNVFRARKSVSYSFILWKRSMVDATTMLWIVAKKRKENKHDMKSVKIIIFWSLAGNA